MLLLMFNPGADEAPDHPGVMLVSCGYLIIRWFYKSAQGAN